MKLTKGPDSPQSGEGTTHEVRSLPTKVRGVDKGPDNAPGLQDIYSLEERVGQWRLDVYGTMKRSSLFYMI